MPAVEEFAEDNPFGGQFQIGCFFHDAGAFSAQLQGDGGQVGSGLLHYLFADGLASGKKDVVKGFLQKAGVLCTASGDGRHIRLLKAFPDDLFHNLAGVR